MVYIFNSWFSVQCFTHKDYWLIVLKIVSAHFKPPCIWFNVRVLCLVLGGMIFQIKLVWILCHVIDRGSWTTYYMKKLPKVVTSLFSNSAVPLLFPHIHPHLLVFASKVVIHLTIFTTFWALVLWLLEVPYFL